MEAVDIRDNIKGGALTETTFLVLLALYAPNHGYGIKQFIEKETNGRVVLGAGTLYGAINALVKKKWLSYIQNTRDSNKKDYLITDLGKQKVGQEIKRISQVLHLASKIIKEDATQ